MVLTAAAVLSLAAQCAPDVAPQTLLALARAESGLDSLAIRRNPGGPAPRQASAGAAIAAAGSALRRGANLDLGLMQINSANLLRLDLTLADAFDPCRGLAAAARLLAVDYRAARSAHVDPQRALRAALSAYNTGDRTRGVRNGYVARVEAAAGFRPAPTPRAPAPFVIYPTDEGALP